MHPVHLFAPRNSDSLRDINLHTRGRLIIEILKNETARKARFIFCKKFKKNTKYFNLFFSDYKDAFWIKYSKNILFVKNIPYGFSMLDSYDLNDDRSIKQNLYREIFQAQQIPNPYENEFSSWQKMLFMSKKYKNDKLSSVFINNYNNNYGTVCSSIIGLPNKNLNNNNTIWLYSERKRDFINLVPFK